MGAGRTGALILGMALLAGPVRSAEPAAQAQTAMGALAASMAPGTWAQLTTTNIVPTLEANGASGAIFGYSEDAAWDPASRQWLYVGGDHNDIARFAAYSADTNTWSRKPQPSWIGSGTMHGYDHNAINPATGDFYHYPFGGGRLFKYAVASATWTQLPSLSVPEYIGVASGVEYFPDMGGVFVANLQGGSAYLFRESTQRWTTLSATLPAHGYHNFAEYNPVRRVMLFGGGNSPGSQKIYKLDAAGTITPLRDSPVGLGINQSIVTVDPVSGDYLVFHQSGSWYVYDIATDAWTPKSGSFPFATPNRSTPVWHTGATPVSTYGVIMFVKFYFGTPDQAWVHLYKHATGGGPSVPVVTVSATDANASEAGANTATFTVTRAGDTSSALTVPYGMSGSATAGADYATPSGSVTIASGATSATVTVTPIDDTFSEGAEQVVLTLSAGAGYAVGSPSSATATLADDEPPPAGDSDGDGLPDAWEIQYFTTVAAQDGTGDPDGDGLTNAQELAAGTHPDRADTDGDGATDGQELAAGTDPLDPASVPAVASGSGEGSEGFCGATGAEALLLAALLLMRSRTRRGRSRP